MKCNMCGKDLYFYIKGVGLKEPNDLNHWRENQGTKPTIYYKEKDGKKIPIKVCPICGKPQEPKEINKLEEDL